MPYPFRRRVPNVVYCVVCLSNRAEQILAGEKVCRWVRCEMQVLDAMNVKEVWIG